MDRIIKTFDKEEDKDLVLCIEEGVAYQKDMTKSVPYDKSYWNKYIGYENTKIAKGINKGRINLVMKYCNRVIMDVGIGSGEFIKNVLKRTSLQVVGYDINKKAVEWLKDKSMYWDLSKRIPYFIQGMTFWDSLEHIPEPHKILDNLAKGTYIFISVPIFTNLKKIRESKHYKPNEHFYYFTDRGLINWLNRYGFIFKSTSDFEVQSGREDIASYAFFKGGSGENYTDKR